MNRLTLISVVTSIFLFGYASGVLSQQNEIKPTDRLPEHPRLFFGKNAENELRNKIDTEKILMQIQKVIIEESDNMIQLPLLTRNQVGRRILHTSREAIRRILFLSYSFRMTGETKYFSRAEQEMLNLAAFDNWNPTHFLDVSEMGLALSIGYDWLYDHISQKNRTTIENAILNKCIMPSTDTKYNKWLKNTNNWNQVCNGGVSAAVVALFNTNPTELAPLMNRAIASLPLAMHEYANNGGYPEGYHYWDYGTTYNILSIDMLTQNWNTDFGLKKSPGFMETARFMQNMEGNFLNHKNDIKYPLCFNYADGSENASVNPSMFWFASENKNPELLFAEISKLKADLEFNSDVLRENRFLPLLLIWSRSIDFKQISIPKRKMYVSNGKTEIALMRTSWTDSNAIFVGVKAGTPSASHQHMDVGSFVLEANGVRWAIDFGNQNYNSLESKGVDLWNRAQQSQRWDVFRHKNTSHNTLIINNQKQLVDGNATINFISDSEKKMCVSMDLTSLYRNDAKKVERKVSVLNKKKVQIEDVVNTFNKEIVLRWNLLTKSTPEIINDKSINLTQEGKKMKIELTGADNVKAYINSTVSPNDYDASNEGTLFVGFDITIPANSTKKITVNLVPVN